MEEVVMSWKKSTKQQAGAKISDCKYYKKQRVAI